MQPPTRALPSTMKSLDFFEWRILEETKNFSPPDSDLGVFMMLGLMLMFCVFFSTMAPSTGDFLVGSHVIFVETEPLLKLPLGPHRIQTQVRRSKYPTLVGKCHKTVFFFPQGCGRCTTFSWWKLGLEPSAGLWNPVCSQLGCPRKLVNG